MGSYRLPCRRIVTASFASHLHRIQQIADAAIADGRKVATLGLSMKKNVRLGLELGVLSIPESSLIDIEKISDYEPGQICVISTGSQGEPMSALSLLARDENKFVKLGEHDTVILSSHAIPGNESNVSRVIDSLHRAGAEVVHDRNAPVHVSGHASQEELKFVLNTAQSFDGFDFTVEDAAAELEFGVANSARRASNEKRLESFLIYPGLLVLIPPFLEDAGARAEDVRRLLRTKMIRRLRLRRAPRGLDAGQRRAHQRALADPRRAAQQHHRARHQRGLRDHVEGGQRLHRYGHQARPRYGHAKHRHVSQAGVRPPHADSTV